MATLSVHQQHDYPDDYYLDPIDQIDSYGPVTATPLKQKHDPAKQVIAYALKKRIAEIDYDNCDAGEEDAFFVADLGQVYRQHLRWKTLLPRVKPHYGMSITLSPLNTHLT